MTIPNQLANSTSPYLLQHAYNPVQWYPWGEEALSKAKQEDKPILLSSGYAACHWCHVMAKESFGDEEVAAIMNRYFINIKLDREENPDIDQIAIEALQRMGLQAGWPLHLFLMPNQKPFYGGTYFTPVVWKQLLSDISFAFKNHRQELASSSAYFTKSLDEYEIKNKISQVAQLSFDRDTSQQIFRKIDQHLDQVHGGIQGSPKFFMPSISTFLLQYHRFTQDERALHQLNLTLTNMACGGVYDHLGGGFYRYATDADWRVPHFEKMLYDNAQLISLYAHAYMATKNSLYKQTMLQTMEFIEREMTNEAGGFYSSLDADSQGIEGALYTWKYEEIEKLLQQDTALVAEYFNLTPAGNWEEGLNILYRNPNTVLNKTTKKQAAIEKRLAQAKQILYQARSSRRERPELNDQVLASWNGMMLQALIDVYYAIGEEHFLGLALKNGGYIERYLIQGDKLFHSYSRDKQGRGAYLEDYAWVAKAFISLYQATFQERWLYEAEKLVQYVLEHFSHATNKLFYFTADSESVFIKRMQEIYDQVIPSSNAVFAHVLFYLGRLLGNELYTLTSREMLQDIHELLKVQPLYMAHWAQLYLLRLQDIPLVTIVGPARAQWGQVLKQHYPDILLLGNTSKINHSYVSKPTSAADKTMAYLCSATACHASFDSLEMVLRGLNEWMSKL